MAGQACRARSGRRHTCAYGRPARRCIFGTAPGPGAGGAVSGRLCGRYPVLPRQRAGTGRPAGRFLHGQAELCGFWRGVCVAAFGGLPADDCRGPVRQQRHRAGTAGSAVCGLGHDAGALRRRCVCIIRCARAGRLLAFELFAGAVLFAAFAVAVPGGLPPEWGVVRRTDGAEPGARRAENQGKNNGVSLSFCHCCQCLGAGSAVLFAGVLL